MSDQTMHWMLMIVGILGSVAAYTAVNRLASPPEKVADTDLTKLAKRQMGMTSAFQSLKADGSLWDRLDIFLIRHLHIDVKLEEFHMLLGRPTKPTPLDMLHQKEIFAGLFGGLAYMASDNLIIAVFAMAIGFLLPDNMFSSKIRARQTEIMRQFPTLVDLCALTIEAGLDYMTALERIMKISKDKGELDVEINKMLSEVSLGYTRKDALKRFAMRTGAQEIRSFVGLIIQSDEMGTSLVDLLRNFASDMRFRRLNKAEKLAAQAATKMLIPLMVFIFPTVFIMMLAPMMKGLMAGGLGF